MSQFTITWPRIPKIGTHDAFINAYVESKFQLSRFYHRLLVIIKQINPYLLCRNLQTKTMVLRAHAKFQLLNKKKIKTKLVVIEMVKYAVKWSRKQLEWAKRTRSKEDFVSLQSIRVKIVNQPRYGNTCKPETACLWKRMFIITSSKKFKALCNSFVLRLWGESLQKYFRRS